MKKMVIISVRNYNGKGEVVNPPGGKKKVKKITEVTDKAFSRLKKEARGRFITLPMALNGHYYVGGKMEKKIKGILRGKMETLGKSKSKLSKKSEPYFKEKETDKEPKDKK